MFHFYYSELFISSLVARHLANFFMNAIDTPETCSMLSTAQSLDCLIQFEFIFWILGLSLSLSICNICNRPLILILILSSIQATCLYRRQSIIGIYSGTAWLGFTLNAPPTPKCALTPRPKRRKEQLRPRASNLCNEIYPARRDSDATRFKWAPKLSNSSEPIWQTQIHGATRIMELIRIVVSFSF